MVVATEKLEAAVKLYGYQKRWIEDKSRFKIGLMCRQIGKSFVVALEAVFDAVETGQNWVLLSAGERQSKELMEKVQMHCKAIDMAAGDLLQDKYDAGDNSYAMLTIRLSNGAKIIGLPANPDTARGFSANVILDEFAFHKDSAKIWKALFPTISKGYKIRVVSTAQGKGNKFHSLWTSDNDWSKHFCDIHQAVADGVEHNIDELKKGIDDNDAWDQEFLCLFIDDALSWLSYTLIQSCYHEQLRHEITYEDFNVSSYEFTPSGRLFAGFDVGRKKDRSIVWLWEQLGDVFWTRLILEMPKIKYRDQRTVVYEIMRKWNVERICIDANGIGNQLAEDAEIDLGSYTAEGVEFSIVTKQDMAVRMKNMFEDRQVRVPNYRVLRDDLHNVKKLSTAGGKARFDADSTKDGHSDRFWAGALGLLASDKGVEVDIRIAG